MIAVAYLGIPDVQAQLVSTVAGQAENTGDADGLALTEALFNNPHGIAVDGRGIVYISDRWNHKIKKYDPNTGRVTTLAGTGNIGRDDGPGSSARFYSPWGITADSVGNVYVADTKNQLIRKIDTLGNVSTLAGTGSFGVMDGPVTTARFADPTGIAISQDGTLYVCDHVAHTIRKIGTNGMVSTIAGKAFIDGYVDGAGAQARFFRPYGIEMDWDGSILIADEWNHRIRRVQPNGLTSTIAGSGQLGSDDGPASEARFNYPWDLVSDQNGAIYVMDGYNHVVRRIEGDSVTTYAGEAGNVGATDGYGIEASFSGATAISMDHRTNALYIGDAFNELIRKIEPSSGVSLLAKTYYPNGDSITYSPGDTLCLGEKITYIARPSTYSNYSFYVNDELTQTNASNILEISPKLGGKVEVEVTAISQEGINFRSEKFALFFVEIPTADFSYQLLEDVSEGFKVQFTAESTGASAYVWDFGDPASGASNTSTLASPLHLYQVEGNYDIRLISIGAGACADTVSKPEFVKLMMLNALDIAAKDTICSGSSASFAASNNDFPVYEFYVNEELVQRSPLSTFTYTPTSAGSQEIRVAGIAQDGSSSHSPPINFFTSPKPKIAFTYTDMGLSSQGLQIDFLANTPGANRFLWDFGDPASGDKNSSELENPTHYYDTFGEYYVKLIAHSGNLCSDTLISANPLLYEDRPSQLFIPNAFTPNSDGVNDILYVRGQNILYVNFTIYNEWGEAIFQSNDLSIGWDGTYQGKPVQADTYIYTASISLSNGEQVKLKGQTTLLR